MTRRIRILQVGLGDWGRDWAWRVNPTVDEAEVVGYVDSDPPALALLAKRLPVSRERCFGSLVDGIQATQPDALLVTTTLAGHAPLVRAGLEAGLHVLVEKPFTDTLETAAELVSLAAAKGLVLMVSQNYRFFPASRIAAQLVREGNLGELHGIGIDFRRDYSSPPKPRFRLHSDPQPLLVDMSIHHFDLLRLVLGREPDRAFCATANAGKGGFDGPTGPAVATTVSSTTRWWSRQGAAGGGSSSCPRCRGSTGRARWVSSRRRCSKPVSRRHQAATTSPPSRSRWRRSNRPSVRRGWRCRRSRQV
ncbi:MAG: Gfo/Idh/MocA family oxidoreductase [Chloroflexi bacterium]|nr:MAG: Gfo/Idh/MocA family oxidoreductase [Chloroflexota bacterium]